MPDQILSNKQVNFILDDSFDLNFWFYQLGISISSDIPINENRFIYPFLNKGKEYWEKLKAQLANMLCNENTKEPNKITSQFLNTEVFLIAEYYAKSLTSEFNFPSELYIPIIAILLKLNIRDFCATM